MNQISPNTKKGIIYVRVSDVGQVSGTSLESQERACIEYAERNGIEIVRTFIEKGESATAADRTEFLKALDFCRTNKGTIDSFIVWKIDRFARNATDHFSVRAKLNQFGTNLFSVTEPITQDAIGKLMETFLAGYAEFENEVRKQRCTGGMRGRLRMGIWCWWPPIGYVHSKKTRDRRKTMPDIPDEERYHLIQRGLKLYRAGNHSIGALTEESNRWGLRTRTGKPMRKQLWEGILTNKFYAGILIDPWDGEEYPGEHKPMITLQEYSDIQKIKRGMSNNATRPRLSFNPDFPLRGLITCSCGKPYTASWSKGRSKRYPGYHCHNPQCAYFGQVLRKETLETKFHELLTTITPRPGFFEAFEKAINAYLQTRLVSDKQDSKRRRSERLRREKQRKELTEMRINKEISNTEYAEMKDALDRQIASLTPLKDTESPDVDMANMVLVAMRVLKNPADAWKGMDAGYKERLQKAVLMDVIRYDVSEAAFGTAKLSPVFRLGREFLTTPSGLVAEAGRNWNQIAGEIRKFSELSGELSQATSDGKKKIEASDSS